MTKKIVIAKRDSDKQGLSLGDLYQFIQEAEAAGFDPRTTVRVTARFPDKLREIRISGEV